MEPALVLSSDSHVFEPPDLWTTRIDRAFRDRASTAPIRFEDGYFLLPDGPGLGVEPNLDALREHAFRPQPRTERTDTLYR